MRTGRVPDSASRPGWAVRLRGFGPRTGRVRIPPAGYAVARGDRHQVPVDDSQILWGPGRTALRRRRQPLPCGGCIGVEVSTGTCLHARSPRVGGAAGPRDAVAAAIDPHSRRPGCTVRARRDGQIDVSSVTRPAVPDPRGTAVDPRNMVAPCRSAWPGTTRRPIPVHRGATSRGPPAPHPPSFFRTGCNARIPAGSDPPRALPPHGVHRCCAARVATGTTTGVRSRAPTGVGAMPPARRSSSPYRIVGRGIPRPPPPTRGVCPRSTCLPARPVLPAPAQGPPGGPPDADRPARSGQGSLRGSSASHCRACGTPVNWTWPHESASRGPRRRGYAQRRQHAVEVPMVCSLLAKVRPSWPPPSQPGNAAIPSKGCAADPHALAARAKAHPRTRGGPALPKGRTPRTLGSPHPRGSAR